ncbi:MAG: LytTR family DNA-binding domain-containing protein [Bacteroidota bacterium]
MHFVEIEDIIRLEASANYTTLYLLDGTQLLLSKNLGYYEKMLAGSQFFRSHQSHLVSLDYVAKYVKTEGGYLLMKDGQSIPVSRLKKEEIKYLFS